jgi:hypothetical protein
VTIANCRNSPLCNIELRGIKSINTSLNNLVQTGWEYINGLPVWVVHGTLTLA